MFEIERDNDGVIRPRGRLDASKCPVAASFLAELTGDPVLDCTELEYISSAGLGVLLATQKRLKESGGGLKLHNLNKHIRDIFRYSGLDQFFEIH